MNYRQVRGYDLQHHAVDPDTGGTLCGLPQRKVSSQVGGMFRPGRAKVCPACETKATLSPRRRPGSSRA